MKTTQSAIKFASLGLGLLLLCGCASMEVKVSIYDRAADDFPFIQAKAERQEKIALKLDRTGKLNVWQSRVASITAQNIGKYVPKKHQQEFIASIRNTANEDLSERVVRIRQLFHQGEDAMAAMRKRDPGDRHSRRNDALLATDSFEMGLKLVKTPSEGLRKSVEFIANAEKLLPPPGAAANQPLVLPPDIAQKADAESAQQADAVATSIVADANESLFADSAAPAIVNAPERYWGGTFNKTYANGQMGNADIAVRMVSAANFELKGVRLDATKVTPAVLSGVRQAVRIAAAAYGVPLPAGNNAKPADGSTSTSSQGGLGDDLTTADTTKRNAQQKVFASRQETLRLMRTILDRRDAITAPQPAAGAANEATVRDARNQAVATIKTTLTDASAAIQINP